MIDIFIRNFIRTVGRGKLYPIHCALNQLTQRAMGLMNDDSIFSSGETAFLKRLAANWPRNRKLFMVDVGARSGAYSIFVKRALPQATIVALEPDPGSFQTLNKKAKEHGFTALQKAASRTPGKVTLYDSSKDKTGSPYASVHQEQFTQVLGLKKPKRKIVAATTVDSLMKQFKIPRIDLLKIDVEGHELSVIKGAKQAIADHKIDRIQFEFEEINMVLGIFVDDFKKCLPDFSLYRILPSGDLLPLVDLPIRHREIFSFQNILAVRKGIPSFSK